MSALVPRDPLPGRPLVYRIDVRGGRHVFFWSKVRQAYLPRLKGHSFWATDDTAAALANLPPGADCVFLDRRLLLQFLPEYVRLTPKERDQIRRFYLERDPTFIRDSTVTKSLRTSRVISGGKLTTLGTNSYYLSP